MKKVAVSLADGRQLIYFDERDDAVRDAVDRRELPPPPPASQLRYDALVDEWVAVAAHRQTRTFLPPTDECPLCPSRDGRQTEIPASDYDVAVFENRFPSFSGRTVEAPTAPPCCASTSAAPPGRCRTSGSTPTARSTWAWSRSG